ncbi:MAG: type II toxin-antitoxin system RelE/ParE family toxin [Deltaproteobacteria bacterium]|nr:type II toxin-antitoxin system RelE/ParE family toxin [Deltaproteobacteria bacterium]
MKIVEYLTAAGRSPFRDWFDKLDGRAAAKVTTALIRMGTGNRSNVESVGGGVYERKIDYGPGYRIYFGTDGEQLVVLVGGGSKKRQAQDIAAAGERWTDYKKRKRQ